MKGKIRRYLALVMSLLMILQCLPVSALAAGRPHAAAVTSSEEITGVQTLDAPVTAAAATEGVVPVTLVADDGNTQEAQLPIGNTATVEKPDWPGYKYHGPVTVEGLTVYEFAIDDDGALYFTTADDQFAAIELGSKKVTIAYKAQDPKPVEYQVWVDGKQVGGKTDNNLFDITGPDVAREGGKLTAEVVLKEGINFLNGWTVRNGDTVVVGNDGVYTVNSAAVTEGKVIVKIETTKKTGEQEIEFRGVNTVLFLSRDAGNNTSLDGGNNRWKWESKTENNPTTIHYHPTTELTFNVTGYANYNDNTKNKVLNKFTISMDGAFNETKLTIPYQNPGNEATTVLLENGIEATLRNVSTNSLYAEWILTIKAKDNRILYGTMHFATNFKDDDAKEVWVNELVGIKDDELRAEGTQAQKNYDNSSKRQGFWINGGWIQAAEDNLTNHITPTGKEYIQRSGSDTVTIYGDIKDGYSKNLSDYEVILKKGDTDYHLEKNEGEPCSAEIKNNRIYIYIPASESSEDIRITIRATRRYQVDYNLNGGSWPNGTAPDADKYLTVAKGVKPNAKIELINGSIKPTKTGSDGNALEFEGWELVEDTPRLPGYMYGVGETGETFTVPSGDPLESDLPVVYDHDNNVYVITLNAVWAGEKSDQTAPYRVNVTFYDANNKSYSTSFVENGLTGQKAYVVMSSLQKKVSSLIDQDKIAFGALKPVVKDIWPDFFTDDPQNVYTVEIKADGTATLNLVYRAKTQDIQVPDVKKVYNGQAQQVSDDGTYEDFEITIGDNTYVVKGLKNNTIGTNAGEYQPVFDTSNVKIYPKDSNVDVSSLIKPKFTGGKLTITPRPVVVTVDDKSKIVRTDDPAFTSQIGGVEGNADSGLVAGESLNGDIAIARTDADAENAEAIGSHGPVLEVSNKTEIDQANPNYQITYEPGNFEIIDVNYKTITVTETITNSDKFDNEGETFTFTLTNVKSVGTLPNGVSATLDENTHTLTLTGVKVGDTAIPVELVDDNADTVLSQTKYKVDNEEKDITDGEAKYRRATGQAETVKVTFDENGNGTARYEDTRWAPYSVYSVIGNPDKNDETFKLPDGDGQYKEFSVNWRDTNKRWGVVGDKAALTEADKYIQAGTTKTYDKDHKFAFYENLSTTSAEGGNHISGTDRATDVSTTNEIKADGKTIIYAVYAQKPTITYNMVIDHADFTGGVTPGTNYVKRNDRDGRDQDHSVLYDYTNNTETEQLWSRLEIGSGNPAYNTYVITTNSPADLKTDREGGTYTFIGWRDLGPEHNYKPGENSGTLYTTEKDSDYQFRGSDHGIWAMWARTKATGETATYDGQPHPGTGDIEWGEGQTDGWVGGKPQAATFVYTKKGSDGTYTDFVTVGAHLENGKYVIDDADKAKAPTDAGDYQLVVKATVNGTKVTGKPADIKITPKELTITAASASKKYDGAPLTAPTSTIEGLIEADQNKGMSATATGSQTYVGSSDNVVGDDNVTWGEVNKNNYTVNYVNGTLTVTDGTPENPVDPEKVVTKTHTDGEFDVGKTITYTITVKNIYDVVKTITLEEIADVTLAQSEFENVQPGATVKTTATYTVNQTDLDNNDGKFKNTVTAKFSDADKEFKGEEELPKVRNSGITIKKTVLNEKAAYHVGDIITYQVEVQNTGNVTLHNVKVTDARVEAVTSGQNSYSDGGFTIANLLPGEPNKVTFTYTYTVKLADVDNETKQVVNTANVEVANPLYDPENPNPDVSEKLTGEASETVTTEKLKVRITAPSDKKVYDGDPLNKNADGDIKVEVFENNAWRVATADEIAALKEVITYGISSDSTITDAGTTPNAFTQYSEGENAKSYTVNNGQSDAGYDLEFVPGTLTVTKRPVTVKSGDASCFISQLPEGGLTNVNVEDVSTGDNAGFLPGDIAKITFNVTGKQSEVGSSPNTFDETTPAQPKETNDKVLNNYTITYTPGTLTVYGLTKTDDLVANPTTPYKPGDVVTYTITLSNPSQYEVTDVVVNESANAGVTLTEAKITKEGEADQTVEVAENATSISGITLPAGAQLVVTASYTLKEADFTTHPTNTVSVNLHDNVIGDLTGTAQDTPNPGEIVVVDVTLTKYLDWFEHLGENGFKPYWDKSFRFNFIIEGVQVSTETENGTTATGYDHDEERDNDGVKTTVSVAGYGNDIPTVENYTDTSVIVRNVCPGPNYRITINHLVVVSADRRVSVREDNAYTFRQNGEDVSYTLDGQTGYFTNEPTLSDPVTAVNGAAVSFDITNHYRPYKLSLTKKVTDTGETGSYKGDTFNFQINEVELAENFDKSRDVKVTGTSNVEFHNEETRITIRGLKYGDTIEIDNLICTAPWAMLAYVNEVSFVDNSGNDHDVGDNDQGFGVYAKYSREQITATSGNDSYSQGVPLPVFPGELRSYDYNNVTNKPYTVEYYVGSGDDKATYTPVTESFIYGYAEDDNPVAVPMRADENGLLKVGDDVYLYHSTYVGNEDVTETANYVDGAPVHVSGSVADGTFNGGPIGIGKTKDDSFGAKTWSKTVQANEVIKLYFQKITADIDKVSAEKSVFEANSVISYTITVQNTSKVAMKDFVVSDPNAVFEAGEGYELVDEHTVKITNTLQPEAKFELKATHTLTQSEVAAGSFTNTATVSVGDNPLDHGDDTITLNPSFEVDKKVRVKGAEDETFHDSLTANVGDMLEYQVVITNTGNVQLTFKAEDIADALSRLGVNPETVNTKPVTENIVIPVGSDNSENPITYAISKAIAANETHLDNKITITGTYEIPNPETGDDDDPDDDTPEFVEKKTDPVTDEVEVDVNPYRAFVITKVADVDVAKAGDTITYTVSVENTGNVALTNVEITDSLGAAKLSDKLPEGVTAEGNVAVVASLAAGESVSVIYTYVVTEADAAKGEKIVNVATATADNPDDPDDPIEPDEPGKTETDVASLKIEKEVTSSKTKQYKLGETVSYKVTVTNTGSIALENVEVKDDHYGAPKTDADVLPAKIPVLAAGASRTFEYTYTVTEADLGEALENVATATADDPTSTDPEDPEKPGKIEVEDTEEVETDEPDPRFIVEKVTTSKAKAESGKYALGEIITYKITVTNTGNVTLTKFTVLDELVNKKWEIPSLEPVAEGKTPVKDVNYAEFTASYEVTEDDIKAGKVINEATATAYDPENPDEPIVPKPGKTEDPTEDPTPKYTVTKVTTSKAKAESGKYALGEIITYKITVTNTGNVTLKNFTVVDELVNKKWTFDSLAPGASREFTTSYVVTEADVKAGKVINEATATAYYPDDPKNPDKPIEPEEPGHTEDETEDPNPKYTVEKVTTSKAKAESGKYALGETITYRVTVTNTGNVTLKNFTVMDELVNKKWTFNSLAPGASREFTTSYVVTAADVKAGKVVNDATATAYYPDDPKNPDKPIEPEKPGHTEDETEPAKPGLAVAKVTTSKPANGTSYALGETITYKITVTNTGNVKLANIEVADKLVNKTWTVDSLDPAKSREFTATHVVTAADVRAGKVINEATAKGVAPGNPDDPTDPDIPVEPEAPGRTEDLISPAPTATPTPTPSPTPATGGGGGAGVAATPRPTTEITGTKVWVDDSNRHNTRPESITVQLLADGAPVSAEPEWNKSGDTWTYTFGEQPAVTTAGITINYTVRETPVAGYETAISGTTITNTLIAKEPVSYTELSGKKTWSDGNNASGQRPTSITVHLVRDGETVETRTVTAGTGWAYSFGRQPVDDGYGNTYTYTVREDGVKGYFAHADGLNLTNTLLADTARTEAPTPKQRVTSVLANKTEAELEDLIELFDYDTPLWGSLLATGDETPIYPFAFAGMGLLALVALLVLGKKRRKADQR